MSEQYLLDLREAGADRVATVGGKGAQLGELARIDGVRVPKGFCVTTAAFRRAVAEAAGIDDLLDRLDRADAAAIGPLSAQIRRTIEAVTLPGELTAEVTAAVVRHGAGEAYAVRSSATAEDLPSASFAGQQDTYLNIVGAAAILDHIRRCWASLFTERAVIYRRRNGFDHRRVRMAVVVQRMVLPRSSGILFTADPVTGNRRVATVDAGFGLGEALVSGLVNPDVFKVRDDEIVDRVIAAKQRAVSAVPGGGTQIVAVDRQQRDEPALTDDQVRSLVRLGRRVAAHFGHPQDIEWCLTGGEFQIVQSRPITTLFPLPEAIAGGNRVYLSTGHQQMMTDPMKPLGISIWQLTAMTRFEVAGGWLYVDATDRLTSPARAAFLDVMGRADPLFRHALQVLLDRDGFLPLPPAGEPEAPPSPIAVRPAADAAIENDPAIVTGLIERAEASLATLRRDIQGRSGPELFDFLRGAFTEHQRVLTDTLSIQAIMAGMQATWWLNDHLAEWLGEQNAADALTLSAPGNITSQMGLALLDVADAIRPHPDAVKLLEEGRLDDLAGAPRAAVDAYLDRYGMRCAGEIDITRPRWSENPATLVPLILDNIKLFEPGAGKRRFDEGLRQAEAKRQEVLTRLRALPDGERKAAETDTMIDRLRTFIGYREYPKYDIVSRFLVYKLALLAEADRQVRAGVLADREDVFFLSFEEFEALVRTGRGDAERVRRRKDTFRSYQSLRPPRVLTSEGEGIDGAFPRDGVPPGALVGLPVSAGTVEGRARVILDMAEADLAAGDILVTTFTDPSWSPLFVAITGLVTEVGGQMTHGAVVAREYGLPAVVGVADATRLIPDGSRIRVHGSDGYVELLEPA
ncbi:rifamycin-inactivating phosphotransferase [Actinoplanes sp. N902-109]|uniref:rifamycin-inactivating phosphotransferase n=1 Tax=Actinoplanes sp. (strain N902-109) TaxID=649831 RepID=UPI0003293FB1|nr:rifamycin-inactivating phosphotransferase [Actinoplanes sp. N902-109]AGL18030.1 phosphoenolpyruvate synthase [Actinoplanes sp. N902-109]